MNILNLLLIWIFFGALSAYIAHKKGRNAPLWFTIGLFAGLLGVILIFFLPPKKESLDRANQKVSLFTILRERSGSAKSTDSKPSSRIEPLQPLADNLFLTPWYYLDEHKTQHGPFDNVIHLLESQTINENSYVWTEGMPKWKRVKEIPELSKFVTAPL